MSKNAAVRQKKGIWSPGKPCAGTPAPGGDQGEGVCPPIFPSRLALLRAAEPGADLLLFLGAPASRRLPLEKRDQGRISLCQPISCKGP